MKIGSPSVSRRADLPSLHSGSGTPRLHDGGISGPHREDKSMCRVIPALCYGGDLTPGY